MRPGYGWGLSSVIAKSVIESLVSRERCARNRGDWFSGWSGLPSARSIGRDERNELSIGKRGRVGLVSRIVPYVWSGDVIETWRGGW